MRASRTRSVHDFYMLDLSGPAIGQGKFSTVYPATNKLTQEPVAVKVITADINTDVDDREFMRTELAIVKLVSHANVVRTIDVFESLNQIFIVMERVRGGDLLHKLQRMGKMS